MAGNSRKYGNNKEFCKAYKASSREERNKKRNKARSERHEAAHKAKIERRIAAAAKDTRKRVPRKWLTKVHNGKHILLGVGITYPEADSIAKRLGLTKPWIERSETERVAKDKEGNDRIEILDAWRYAFRYGDM